MKKSILIIVLFITSYAFGQSPSELNIRSGELALTLEGTLSDFKTSELLPFVNIVVEQEGKLVAGGQSDFDGHYRIRPIPAGVYDIRVSAVGYETRLLEDIEITQKESNILDITLNNGGVPVQMICCFCCCFSIEDTIEIPIDLIAEQDSINKAEDKLLPSAGFETVASRTEFVAYPNPTQGLMTLRNLPQTEKFLLIDMSGQIIQTIYTQDDSELTLNLGSLPRGMYLLKYKEFGQQKTKKLLRL
tara:strand:+ start:75117 stop:75854 length:738 start_codon:yes stop_codon:yes gene_type:complete